MDGTTLKTVLIVGDWSNDGHGLTENIHVDHNLRSKSELQAAHDAGWKTIGADFEFDKICEEYNKSTLTQNEFETLRDAGLLDMEYDDLSNIDYTMVECWYNRARKHPKSPYYLDADEYVEIWLRIAKLGHQDLEYSVVPSNNSNKLNIGGYGFFE